MSIVPKDVVVDATAAWNAQADEFNQWDDLGEDEKLEWVANRAAEWALEQAARGPVLSGGIPNPELDADWDWIETEARRTYRHHETQVLGTTLTRADDLESHVVWATLAWVRSLLERAKR